MFVCLPCGLWNKVMLILKKIILLPLGYVCLTANKDYLLRIDHLQNHYPIEDQSVLNENDILKETEKQLSAYFLRKLMYFSIPLQIEGTDFQRLAWSELMNIPYGKTISYSEQAQNIGYDKAYRAVGLANHKNPISIIIPCHRVVGKNKKLVGYAGGLNKKKYLHNIEEIRL